MTGPEFSIDTVTEIDVPAGHIASVVTYLKRTTGPQLTALTSLESRYTLTWAQGFTAAEYKQLFRQVGGPWLWFSRIALDDAALQAILDEPTRHIAVVYDRSTVAGYVEMDAADPQNAYVSFIGVAPGYEGRGLGQHLMEQGIARVWGDESKSVLTHTCTLDHPRALSFYLKSGFVATRRAIEVAPDPRIKGLLAPDIRPEYPLL